MSRRNSRAVDTQLRQIDAIFRANEEQHVVTIVDVKKDKNCDFHRNSPSRRGSVDIITKNNNVSRKGSVSPSLETKQTFCSTDKLNEKMHKKNARNSIASFTELVSRNDINDLYRKSVDRVDHAITSSSKRRDSTSTVDGNGGRKNSQSNGTWNGRLFKGMEHPSNFPNMLRSSQSQTKVGNFDQNTSRRASSNWNVNHFHNYTNGSSSSNLDRKQSLSTSEKIYRRDYTNGNVSNPNSPEPKKELHSILKQNGHNNNNGKKNTSDHEDELKEIIKRLSFDYIEKEMSQNGNNNNRMDIDLLSNSDSSSGGTGRILTSTKLAPRRISIDSLDSSSRRSSRRYSDFSVNSDDYVTFKTSSPRQQQQPIQVSSFLSVFAFE